MAHRARFFSVWRGRGSAVPSGENNMNKFSLHELQLQSDAARQGTDKRKRSALRILQAPRRSERRIKMILFRDILMLINAMAGLFVAIILLELSWNGRSLKNTWGDQIAKYFISVSTVILVMQIIEYYVMIIYMRMKDMKHSSYEKSMIKIKNPTFLMVWNNSSIKWKFWVEILACLPHPFPGIGTDFDKIGTLLMFCRLFILVKVLRDLSPVWNAKAMPHIPGYSHAIQPTFTAWRAFKVYFYGYPVTFVTVLLALVCLVTTYAIYIFERESQPSFTFGICFYITVTSMFLGWPSDVFNIYNAVTWGAKIISIIASVIGIFLFALLIDYLHSVMQLSYNEKFIYDWLNKREYDDKIRDEAAKLIQAVWRHHQWKRHKDEVFMHSGVSDVDRRRLTKKERKAFNIKLVYSMKRFQQARRRKFMRFGADDPSLHPGISSAPASEVAWESSSRAPSPTLPSRHSEHEASSTTATTLPSAIPAGILDLKSKPKTQEGINGSQPSINGDSREKDRRSLVRVPSKRPPIMKTQSFITNTPHFSSHHGEHGGGIGGGSGGPLANLSGADKKAVNDYVRDQVEQMRREMMEDMKYLLLKQKEDLLADLRRGSGGGGGGGGGSLGSGGGTFSDFPYTDQGGSGGTIGGGGGGHTEGLMFSTPPHIETGGSSSGGGIGPAFPSRLNVPIERKREKGKEKENMDYKQQGSKKKDELEIVIDRNIGGGGGRGDDLLG